MKTRIGAHEYTPGAVVAGKYRLLHRLGEGGMGSIWAAHHPTLDISVALKLIRLDTANDDANARLIQEARATARLADPGIVRIFDVGHTEQGDPFISMELLAGTNLRQALDGGPFDPVRATRTLLPIVRALECAHRAGIVHRDVKPENIVIAVGTRGDLQPKLVDFGVAKILTRPNQLTSMGSAVGSPLYMSPEQARGEPIDARTDLWSMCVVLYEAIMGTPPFDAANANALLHAIATQAAPTLAGRGVCDEALSQIIDRGLRKQREERWQHARDLLLALAEWLREKGVTDDITGLSLRGRGLGPRSMPAASLTAFDASQRSLANAATAVNLARSPAALGGSGPERAQLRAGAAGPGPGRLTSDAEAPGSAALAPTALGPSPEQRTGALMWAALAFISLALVLLGVLVWRRPLPTAERVAQPPAVSMPAARGANNDRAGAPAQTARDTPARDVGPTGERAPGGNATPPGGSERTASGASGAKAAPRGPRATQRDVVQEETLRTRARAERPRSAKPAAPKLSPSKPSPPPGPFKNPFE